METVLYDNDPSPVSWHDDTSQTQEIPVGTANEADATAYSSEQMYKGNRTEASGSRACETCRRKKRKCTFEKPSCYLCSRSKTQCVYGGRKRKPGPPRGSKRLRNHDLLARIATLESMMKGPLLSVDNFTDNSFVPGFAPKSPPTSAYSDHGQGLSACDSFPTLISGHLTSYSGIPDAPDPQLVSLVQSAVLDAALQTHLLVCPLRYEEFVLTSNRLEVYLDHIQPAFPLFRRPTLFDHFSKGLLPVDLLAVMMALAARFSPRASSFLDLDLDGWEALLNCSSTCSSSCRLAESADVLDLNAVKKECLVALFEYTRSPGLRAWKQAGVMTRTAFGYGLHNIDNPNNHGLFGDNDAEECRFVWWTIWKLDCCFNGVALTPLTIDDRFTNTYLASTTVSDFTMGNIQPSSRIRLDLSISGLEQYLRRMNSMDLVALETLEIYFVGLIRETHMLRCRMSTAPEECRQGLKNTRSTCYIIRKCFPAWFLRPQRAVEKHESHNEHRVRLMTLVQYNILCINCHLPMVDNDEKFGPLDIERWQQCVGFAKEMVALFHCWDVSYDTQVDPMITCAMWYISVLLAIQAMSVRLVNIPLDGERRQLETVLAYMVSTLRRFSTSWALAEKLLDSIEQLWKWIWLDIDWPGMQNLVEQLRTLLDPNSPEPTRIHVCFPDINT